MAKAFISYSRHDREIAERLAHALIARGHDVWWDRDLIGGDDFRRTIARALKDADVAFVIWTANAIGSRWVLDEADLAVQEQKLIPVAFTTDVEMPIGFGQFHVQDLSQWNGDPQSQEFVELDAKIEAIITGHFREAMIEMGQRVAGGRRTREVARIIASRLNAGVGGLPIRRFFTGAGIAAAGAAAPQALGQLLSGASPIGSLIGAGVYFIVFLVIRALHQLIVLSKGLSSRRYFDESFNFWLLFSALLAVGMLAADMMTGGGTSPMRLLFEGPNIAISVLATITIARVVMVMISHLLRNL